MTSAIDLSIVMPVHNEEAVLAEVLTEAMDTLARCGLSHELVLVDDASTDTSPAILAEFQARYPETVRVLRNATNAGIIATCDRLYASARGKLVFVNSSDGQWKCAEVLPMLALADQHDLVVGRRTHKRYGTCGESSAGCSTCCPGCCSGSILMTRAVSNCSAARSSISRSSAGVPSARPNASSALTDSATVSGPWTWNTWTAEAGKHRGRDGG